MSNTRRITSENQISLDWGASTTNGNLWYYRSDNNFVAATLEFGLIDGSTMVRFAIGRREMSEWYRIPTPENYQIFLDFLERHARDHARFVNPDCKFPCPV